MTNFHKMELKVCDSCYVTSKRAVNMLRVIRHSVLETEYSVYFNYFLINDGSHDFHRVVMFSTVASNQEGLALVQICCLGPFWWSFVCGGSLRVLLVPPTVQIHSCQVSTEKGS